MTFKNIKESLFTIKKKVVAFGGGNDDLIWVYTAGDDDKNMSVLAEMPNEIVHIKMAGLWPNTPIKKLSINIQKMILTSIIL
jgi:hypothetical protein